jgi:hypothetical protein
VGRRGLPDFDVLWKRHVAVYTEVFSSALTELAGREAVTGDEDAISESLCPIFARVCFRMTLDGKGEVREPVWEQPRQPVTDEELTGGKKRKRPDFTCSFYNSHPSRPEDLTIPFHSECKLLGHPTSPSWNLNRNYVTDGMARFDSSEHQYGKRAPAGMMIGYIIGMCPGDIEIEVNGHKDGHLKHFPCLSFAWDAGYVHQTEQAITRQHVTPAKFSLTHIWADLRQNYG